MKADPGIRKNHLNHGPHRSMAAQHEKTRLPDPEDISGGGNPGCDDTLLAVHENKGGHKGGMAATHHVSDNPDAHELPVDIMDKE